MLAVWRSRFGYSVFGWAHCPEYFMMFNEARSQKSSLSALGRRGAAMGLKGRSENLPAFQRDVDRGG